MSDAMQMAYSNAPEVVSSPDEETHKIPCDTRPRSKCARPCAKEYEKEPKILGLERRTLGLVIALVVAMAIGIGGGVGGTLAVRNNQSKAHCSAQSNLTLLNDTNPPLPPTTVASMYSPPEPTTISLINGSCGGNQYSWTDTFDMNIRDGYKCEDQTNYPGNDIAAIVAYNMELCIDACSMYNVRQKNRSCTAVSLRVDMRNAYLGSKSNCWLKSKIGGRQNYTNVFSAMMCDDPDCLGV